MDSENSATDRSENSAGELVLRLRGTSQDGQFFRLRPSKCTIGSGEKCTLRLSNRHAAPLHCLILRGQGGTIARRWAPETRLNGQPFSDAELTPGDTLGIGPLEFEVVALNEGGDPAAMQSSAEHADTSIPIPGDSRGMETREPSDLIESLKAEKAAFDLRNHQLNQEVAALANEKQFLEREKSAYIDERNAFLAIQNEFLAKQDALRIAQETFLEAQNALQAVRQGIAQEQQSLNADREACSEERKVLEAHRAALLEEQRALRADLQRERERFLKEMDDFRNERETRRSELQRGAAELAAATQAAADLEKVDIRQKRVEAERQPPRNDDPNRAAPDLQEILHRLGHSVDFADDIAAEPHSATAESAPADDARPSAESGKPASIAKSDPPAEDEESIDNYMAQLMQRLGAKAHATINARLRTDEQTASGHPAERDSASETPPLPPEAVLQRREPAELTPRAVAPEKGVDLSALRDLANLSAEHALGKHEHRQLSMAKRSKLIVIGVSLAVGAGLLWHWRAQNGGILLAITAVLSFMIALYWGLQYAILTGRLTIDRAGGIALRKPRGDRRPPALPSEAMAGGVEKRRSADNPDAAPRTIADESGPASRGECPADSK
ncbi:MAG: hypothetical protein IT426_06200 [Pirellulales bacterium]|nr:hypothetical protein [Pirellulales bacterium]